MATQAYWNWKNAGAPWSSATPIGDFSRTMRGHGYTVYVLGADDPSHLQADQPEDHCPFSQTPWPGPQPYPRVLALDIMPGGAMDWRALGEKIVADKNAGVPGTEWIKYINYEDRNGNCWHASWQPNYARRSSSDRGHIHMSGRTDYVDAHTAYDPFNAAVGGNDMGALEGAQAENAFNVFKVAESTRDFSRDVVQDVGRGVLKPFPNQFVRHILAIEDKLSTLAQARSAGILSDAQYADLKAAMLAQVPSREDLADALIARAAGK